jgi:hypothetical protein
VDVRVFSTKSYDRHSLEEVNAGRHALVFLEPRLDATTVDLATGAATPRPSTSPRAPTPCASS